MADTSAAAAAAAPSSEARGGVERLPDGRPKATRRPRKQHEAERQGPSGGGGNGEAERREAALAAAAAWVAWHAAADREWRAKTAPAVGMGVALVRTPIPNLMEQLERSLPVIRKTGIVTSPQAALDLWRKYKRRGNDEEFAVAPIYAPQLIAELAPLGIFPMTIPIGHGIRLPAFKLHVQRAVVSVMGAQTQAHHAAACAPFAAAVRSASEPLTPCKPMSGVSKTAKRFHVVINQHWDEVCDMVHQQHGYDWLTKELRAAFTQMFLQRKGGSGSISGVQLHCIAIVESTPPNNSSAATEKREIPAPSYADSKKPFTVTPSSATSGPVHGRVVAGELGYSFGAMYSSLTGAYAVSGTGTLQLAMVQAALHLAGFRLWDLGMNMDYKAAAIGVVDVPRRQWVELAVSERDADPAGVVPTAAAAEALQAHGLPLLPPEHQADESVAAALASRLGAVAPVPTPCDAVLSAFRQSLASEAALAA